MGDSGQVRPPIVLQSTITCPRCGAKKTETMPTDACVFVYECGACGGHFAPNAAIAASSARTGRFSARPSRSPPRPETKLWAA